MKKLNRIQIFLASSEELKEERNALEIALHRLNKRMISQNIFLELHTWEESDFMKQTNLQTTFRNTMYDCEIFVSLFFAKVGKYTKEEFENARDRFNKGENPQYIFTYFKNAPINISSISKDNLIQLFNFKENLQQLGHFYTEFSNKDELIYHFSNQLEKIMISKNPSKKKDRNNIFISYSHKDKTWLDELLLFFKPLQKKKMIKVWSDKEIALGAKWKDEIKNALSTAKVGLLLITQEFLASDFITDEEIPKLIQSSEEEGAIILPVILEPCTIQFEEELNQFQFFNSPDKPLSSLTDNERKMELVKLTNSLKDFFEKK